MVDTSCPFCAIIMGEGPARVVYRDDHAVAFFPLRPATFGHTLVVPRRHIPDIWELPEAAVAHLSRAALRVAAALRAAVAPGWAEHHPVQRGGSNPNRASPACAFGAALGSRCYGPYLAGSSPQLPSAGARQPP